MIDMNDSDDIDDDYDDVDWEVDDQPIISSTNLIHNQPVNNTNLTDITEEDFTIINKLQQKLKRSSGSNSNITKETSGKRFRVIPSRYREEHLSEALWRHKQDILCSIQYHQIYSIACNNLYLQHLMLSILPLDLHYSTLSNIEQVSNICQWFVNTFKVLKEKDVTIEEGLYGSYDHFLTSHIFPNRCGAPAQLHQLLVSLFRALNISSRLVCCIIPRSWNPSDHSDIRFEKQFFDSSGYDAYDLTSENYNMHMITNTWIEVPILKTIDDNSHWNSLNDIDSDIQVLEEVDTIDYEFKCIHLNYLEDIGNNDFHESLWKLKNEQLIYIIGVEKDGYLIDLTLKYWTKQKLYHKLMISKLDNLLLWLKDLWRDFKSSKTSDCILSIIAPQTLKKLHCLRLRELEQLNHLNNSHSTNVSIYEPKTFQDFKDHPTYLLERFLKVNECLHPEKKKVIKMFRGEPVYLQQYKEILYSRINWEKRRRKVSEDQINCPFRVIRKGKRNVDNVTLNGENSRAIEVKLYGSWQTIKYPSFVIIDEILPHNEYGHIEIWDGVSSMIPIGSSLITHPNAIQAAKLLNIPYVPAVFGFDLKAGSAQYLPRFGGCIVLPKHRLIVEEACNNIWFQKLEDQYANNEKKIISKWEKLTRMLTSRQALREKYGF